MSRNVLLKVPRLTNPDVEANVGDAPLALTEQPHRALDAPALEGSGAASRGNAARKVRMKCASDTRAMRASAGTSSGSA